MKMSGVTFIKLEVKGVNIKDGHALAGGLTAASVADAFLLGLVPTAPVNQPSSSSRLNRDVCMAIYHNLGSAGTDTKGGAAPNSLRAFLESVKQDLSVL